MCLRMKSNFFQVIEHFTNAKGQNLFQYIDSVGNIG